MDGLTIGADLSGMKLLFVRGQHTLRIDTGSKFSPEDFAAQLNKSS